mgnify:FL=1
MKDILSFTKNISGINLVDYVINYINQNMIIYSLLKNTSYSISACTDGTCVTYDITGFSSKDIDIINTLPSEQDVVIYGQTYKIMTHIPDNNKLIIKIM